MGAALTRTILNIQPTDCESRAPRPILRRKCETFVQSPPNFDAAKFCRWIAATGFFCDISAYFSIYGWISPIFELFYFRKKIFMFEFSDCGQVKDYALVLNVNIVTNRHYIRIFQMQTACIKIKILQYNIIMIAIRKHDPHFFVSLWDFSFLYS